MKHEALYRTLGVDVDTPAASSGPTPAQDPNVYDFNGGVRPGPPPGRPVGDAQLMSALFSAAATGHPPEAFLPAGSNPIRRMGDSR